MTDYTYIFCRGWTTAHRHGAKPFGWQVWRCTAALLPLQRHRTDMPGFFETIWDARYRRRIQHLRELLEEQDIPLRVVEGMEIFATDDVLERLNSGQLICLNHTRYPLVEFAFEVDAMEIYRQMDRLLNAGYKPILAHPERYHCVMQDRSCIYDWYRMGIVIQINKGSILGRFGKHIQRTADAILRHRLAAVIALDAHGSLFTVPRT